MWPWALPAVLSQKMPWTGQCFQCYLLLWALSCLVGFQAKEHSNALKIFTNALKFSQMQYLWHILTEVWDSFGGPPRYLALGLQGPRSQGPHTGCSYLSHFHLCLRCPKAWGEKSLHCDKCLLYQTKWLSEHHQAVCENNRERPSGNSYLTQSLHQPHCVGLEKWRKSSPPFHSALTQMNRTNLKV